MKPCRNRTDGIKVLCIGVERFASAFLNYQTRLLNRPLDGTMLLLAEEYSILISSLVGRHRGWAGRSDFVERFGLRISETQCRVEGARVMRHTGRVV
jgi:hypothetical protein